MNFPNENRHTLGRTFQLRLHALHQLVGRHGDLLVFSGAMGESSRIMTRSRNDPSMLHLSWVFTGSHEFSMVLMDFQDLSTNFL